MMIVDEVHSYRGIFGVHMTGIVRRLLFTSPRGWAPTRALSSHRPRSTTRWTWRRA